METKFKIGDHVEVVNYGHLKWSAVPLLDDSVVLINGLNPAGWLYDLKPKLVGQRGIVDFVGNMEGDQYYDVRGVDGKYAFFKEDQLEKYPATNTIRLQHSYKEGEIKL